MLIGVAALCVPAAALGQHNLPRARALGVEPGNPDHLVVSTYGHGLIATHDGGATWGWVCPHVYGGDFYGGDSRSGARLESKLTMLPGGAVLIPMRFEGLQVSPSGNLCDFRAAPEFRQAARGADYGKVVEDVASSRNDASRTYVLTSTAYGFTEAGTAIEVKVWASTDGGASWQVASNLLPANEAGDSFAGTSLVVAPSNPQRLYVSGKFASYPRQRSVQRSSDGGKTWQAFPLPEKMRPEELEPTDRWEPRLQAVDREDDNIVYLRVDAAEESGTSRDFSDALWMSADGAKTWRRIHRSADDLPGFALSPDGSTLAIAGPAAGLQLASTVDVASGRETFTQVFDDRLWGLTWTAQGLFAGYDQYPSPLAPSFYLGMTEDRGETLEPLMHLRDVKPAECLVGTEWADVCAETYESFQQDYVSDLEGYDEPVTGSDAGSADASGEDAGTVRGPGAGPAVMPVEATTAACGCRVPGRFLATSAGWSLLALCLAGAARRSRRRRSLGLSRELPRERGTRAHQHAPLD